MSIGEMNMFESIGMLFVGALGLIAFLFIACEVIELVRRWFVKPEYPCQKCGSRYTLLSGKYFGIDSGSFYKTRCLACGHQSGYTYSYYRGKGRSVGRTKIGWESKSLSDVIAEDRQYKERSQK